jgi:hypothetical protein
VKDYLKPQSDEALKKLCTLRINTTTKRDQDHIGVQEGLGFKENQRKGFGDHPEQQRQGLRIIWNMFLQLMDGLRIKINC